MQRKPCCIEYGFVPEPHKPVGFSDSAFKALHEEAACLALRGLAVLLATDKSGVLVDGSARLMEYLFRRLQRVVRSTFRAELNALVDAIETLLLEQSMLHQIRCGTHGSAEELLQKSENGQLVPPLELYIDARARHAHSMQIELKSAYPIHT